MVLSSRAHEERGEGGRGTAQEEQAERTALGRKLCYMCVFIFVFPSLRRSPLNAQTLATEPLRNSSITIKQVTAKKSRLVIEGDMSYDSARVPFTYRTSIGVKGQVRDDSTVPSLFS